MPNTVPAAAAGLPEDTAVLAETGTGLAVVRPASIKALRPTFLTEEETDTLLSLLDEIQSARQLEDAIRDRSDEMQRDAFIGRLEKARRPAEHARRKMISPLKKVRAAKSKSLDDILFKALIVEVIDSYGCTRSQTLGHSIVNDLLSADCMWRAA